ncbi:unnamed protein product, partial [Brassica oleracea var. botrytis]
IADFVSELRGIKTIWNYETQNVRFIMVTLKMERECVMDGGSSSTSTKYEGVQKFDSVIT